MRFLSLLLVNVINAYTTVYANKYDIRMMAISLCRSARLLKSPENYLKAASLYEELLKKEENDYDRFNAAESFLGYMRMKTKGNTITIEGCIDTSEHKDIWKKYGPKALKHTEILIEKKPNDPKFFSSYVSAFMFESSSKGILKQALTGAGQKFINNAHHLQKIDPKYDDALGHTLEGCFYLVAPWPVRNHKKATKLLEKAVKIAPNSQRNHYHLGVCSYMTGNYEKAKEEFTNTINCEASGNDIDYTDFIVNESKRVLEKLS